MVGLKRCYICGEAFKRDDEMVKCEHCHIWCHQACQVEREGENCPRCDEEAWVSVAEF